jgi:poly-gamma-glutamate capsule biosynthesis protein CapA/YwtB (metallophosphatase superfamily)
MLQFTGDVYLDKAYKVEFSIENYVLNLEYPLSKVGEPAKGKVNLGQNTSFLEETFGQNPLAVCLANNHVFDFGDESYQDTVSFLRNEGISFFGAGHQDNNFNNPTIIDGLEGRKVAIFGYCCDSTHPASGGKYSVAPLCLKRIRLDIENIKNTADFIVIQIHWGDEEIIYPKPKDIDLAMKIIDCGADLIIGHHAHVIQSSVKYKNKNIFFGIGNLIFPNLNEYSYFDGDSFQSKYEKKQSENNKKSIIVTLDENFEIGYKGTYFDGNSLVEKKHELTEKILNNSEYNNFVKWHIRRLKIKNFLKKPSDLSVGKIARFIKG